MNSSNQPKNYFLAFLKSIGIGLYAFFILVAICIATVLFIEGFEIQQIEHWLSTKSGVIITTFIQFLTLFILPPILFARYIRENFWEAFQMKKKDSLYKYILAIVFTISLFPLLITLEGWVEKIPFSSELAQKAELQKKNLEMALDILLNDTSILNFMVVFSLISLLAGFAEELFFRGLLLRVLIHHTNHIVFGIIVGLALALVFDINLINVIIILVLIILLSFLAQNANTQHKEYLAVIICSFIFAAMHFSIYNFAPILLAGMAFGLVALKTRNLKITILMHTFFNGLQLILNYLYQTKVISINLEEEKQFSIPLLVVCLITLSLSLFFIIKPNEDLSHKS